MGTSSCEAASFDSSAIGREESLRGSVGIRLAWGWWEKL